MLSEPSERSNSFQIVRMEDLSMSKHHLEEQARRAERLARSVMDTATVERLLAFAAECRAKASLLDEMPKAA